MRLVGLVLAVVLIGIAGLLAYAQWRSPDDPLPDAVYRLAFGEPYLGPVDFASYARRASPNEALACSEGACAQTVDVAAPRIFINATNFSAGAALEEALRAAITAGGETFERQGLAWEGARIGLDGVIRTRTMRFPDTLNLEIVAEAAAGPVRPAVVRMLSRSQIGYSDQGANKARLERLAAALSVFTEAAPLGGQP
jgi:hypothetical protein